MRKFKKFVIAFVPAIVLLGIVIYLIAINNNMLLNPKVIVSNYTVCQKSDYRISTQPSTSSIHKEIIARYIDSDNGYDYYIESLYNGSSGKVEEDYFVKKKDNKIVAVCDLTELDLAKRNDLYVYCGFYSNGKLYFTVEGTNSLFCIDDCLNKCDVFFTPQKFGNINAGSFCIAEDSFYYITDSGNLVKYDGTEEVQIKQLPDIPSAFESYYSENKEYKYFDVENSSEQPSKFSYYLNYINGEFYYGMEDKLFRVDKDGNAEYLNFEIPQSSSGDSHIYRIEPYEADSDIVAVSFYYVDMNTEGESSGTVRYLINTQNGDYVKCKQQAKKMYRSLSDNDFAEYVDNLKSKAGIKE